jgi:RND family efflux transporter MFP subunit
MILIILVSCGQKKSDATSSATSWKIADKEAVSVFTDIVREEPFVQAIEASGILEGIREADVISETSGLIRSVSFQIGQFVSKGDILVRVEDRIPQINYEFAQQDLKTAELEFEALKKSYNTGGTSLVVYNQGLTKVEAARLRLEQAFEALDRTKIKAPFSGLISSRVSSIVVGSYIQPGTVVTHIVDNSSFQVNLTVGEDEIILIDKGEKAHVLINSLPDSNIDALVSAVSPGSRNSNGGFPVVVSWENKSGVSFKSGMSVRVRINPKSFSRKELIVPSSALVYRNGLPYVFRIKDNAAEAVELVLLRSLGDRTAVKDSLVPGEALIVSGLNSLVPGDPVLATPLPEEALQ